MNLHRSLDTTRLLLPCVALAAGCASHPATRAPRPAEIGHIVLIKLNEPARRDALIADCDSMLRGIPGVVAYACGPHVDAGRANVDSSYDVGLYIGFNTLADYAAYVEHPEHVSLVAKWKPDIGWMKIYDVGDPTP